jgi:hypothetical protein
MTIKTAERVNTELLSGLAIPNGTTTYTLAQPTSDQEFDYTIEVSISSAGGSSTMAVCAELEYTIPTVDGGVDSVRPLVQEVAALAGTVTAVQSSSTPAALPVGVVATNSAGVAGLITGSKALIRLRSVKGGFPRLKFVKTGTAAVTLEYAHIVRSYLIG